MRRVRRLSLVTVLTCVSATLSVATPTYAADAPYYWQQRAVKYAPMLVLHRDERYKPASVGWTLERSTLRFSRRYDTDVTLATRPSASRIGDSAGTSTYAYTHRGRRYLASDCTRALAESATCDRGNLYPSEGFFLDIADGAWGGQPNSSTTPGRYAGPEIYYQYGPVSGGGWFITYWFFYPYNHFAQNNAPDQRHEGDWERLVIRFDSAYRPIQAAYHHHNCHQVFPWSSVPKTSVTHPVAYVAKGSHGIWRGAGGQCPNSPFTDTTDTTGGRKWLTWTGTVAWVRSRGFYGFGGAWGEIGISTHTTGPLGPSRYKSYSPF